VKLKSIAIRLSLIASLTLTMNTFAAQKFSADQKKEIQQVVHDYLMDNPDILIQMSQKLQQQQAEKVQDIEKHAQKVIPSIANELFNDKNSPIGGNVNGTVTLVEFFDYQCPHCKEMTKIIDDLAKQNSNLRIVYKEFPIFGGTSDLAAKAALAANKQGKYDVFHDALMNTDASLDEAKIMSIAKKNGIDVNQLKKDMDSDSIQKELKQNVTLAKKLKLMGTPAFVIGQTNNAKSAKSVLIPGTTSQEILQNVITQVKNNKVNA